MAFKLCSSNNIALFFTLNLLFFALVSGCGYKCSNPKHPNPNPNNPNNNTTCPRDALKLGICANVLSGLLNITLGQPPVTPCCSLLSGLVDLEAAICLCTALRGNILGININFQSPLACFSMSAQGKCHVASSVPKHK
ncbi:hypothetical protein Ahy_A01g002818 isoform G [Arachis hypogaea]|uniref:Hydrophobic seed protein domain-containing protein n=1 Tax=Arachis hypogaea TaxID=3818 RepID=A0A445ERF8_ARAHY|nr:hypothetical protein Ahy_A01g002818 isoform G [Arachis hypogaea]